ncbi:MAG TPA: aldo/keto reductase [Candidatus Limnocylindria bacterium]|nr:aldo/keto reductase [Candidatus Limnocylindria bacterium]
MRYRSLGRTDLRVSALGLGANQLGRIVDAAGAKAIIDRAQELGVNFIDTAESYGDGASETLIGQALAGRRDRFVVATKTGAGSDPGRLTRERIAERLDASLRRLATDHVDVYYLHMPDAATPLEESLRALEDARRAGKIRYPAISNHPAWQVAEAIALAERNAWTPVVASQMEYSLVERAVEREMVPACLHFGVSLVPYFPLAGGFLTGKYPRDVAPPPNTRFGRAPQRSRFLSEANFDRLARWTAFAEERGRTVGELAVAWLLAHPVVPSVIAGATSAEQLGANAIAADWELSADEVSAL